MLADRPPPVWLRIMRRLLGLVGLAWGVVALLFLILESGVTGDPALRALGKQASPQALGEARVELGYFSQYRATALDVEWLGPPGRLILHDASDGLVVHDLQGMVLASVTYKDLDLAEFSTALSGLELGEGRRIQVRPRAQVDQPAMQAPTAELAASGIGAALRGGQVAIDSRRPTTLGWAEARSPLSRFAHQSWRLFRLDFGRSLDGQSVANELTTRAGRSLALTLPAFCVAMLAALSLALLSVRRGGRLDRGLVAISALVVAITPIAWILLMRQGFAVSLDWFPVAATSGLSITSLALPALIWAWVALWPEFQIVRGLLAEAAHRPHVVAARARGISESQVWRRHVLRVCLPHLIAQLALALPFLVLGSLILERVFVIPGLGSYIVEAAQRSDPAVLRAATFVLALLYLCCQELGEWLRRHFDPRLQTLGMEAK